LENPIMAKFVVWAFCEVELRLNGVPRISA
jgi:hypothetical protein